MLPIAAAALLLSITIPGAPRHAVHLPRMQADTAIGRIRREYAAVNAMLPRCAVQTLEVWGKSLEGGEMKVYRCGGETRKIVADYLGETGADHYEWYLSAGQPFFLLLTEVTYREPLGPVASRTAQRFYLRGDRLIRWLGDNGRARGTNTAEAREKLDFLRGDFADLLDRARTGRTDAP